ncbi:hypothetical protein [Rivularia sp. PCC 7116]|uniref:hypothetical protein n=1 Tax=Rivularia sp. PCC 7116 TaxID=373994 RepID=UPI0002D4A03F|nr:hypothetical protein [Rivularia sp. PCC 7116]
MKSPISHTFIIYLIVIICLLIQNIPSTAHERRFHRESTQPNSSDNLKIKNLETPINISPTPKQLKFNRQATNSENKFTKNSTHLIPQPGEIVFLLLLGGTGFIYFAKYR